MTGLSDRCPAPIRGRPLARPGAASLSAGFTAWRFGKHNDSPKLIPLKRRSAWMQAGPTANVQPGKAPLSFRALPYPSYHKSGRMGDSPTTSAELVRWRPPEPARRRDLSGKLRRTVTMSRKLLVAWSGGKDSAFALQELVRTDEYEIVALLTTVTAGYDRISMHGVRKTLLARQAESLGYPLETILIPQECTNEDYERLMQAALHKYRELGVTGVMFGDLFLQDVRQYREQRLQRTAMQGIFPIWGMDTGDLAEAFIDCGFRAIVTCVDTEFLDARYAGRQYDRSFLADLPRGVDLCGENGEFHTFVYDGPLFSWSIRLERGARVLRENRFYYCDLVPISHKARQSG